MPSTSQKQKDFFKLVKAFKNNAINGAEVSDAVKKAADSMTNKQIDDFLTLQEEFDSYIKEEVENSLDEESSKKYGRNKLFNIQAMQEIIKGSNFLTNQYDKLKERGKEIFGYHYNEIILSFMFLKFIKPNKELFKKYLATRANIVKQLNIDSEKEKAIQLGLETPVVTEPEVIKDTETEQKKDETELEETTSGGVFGVGGFPSTPCAFAKGKNNFKSQKGLYREAIKRTLKEDMEKGYNKLMFIDYNGTDLNGNIPNELFDGQDANVQFVTDLTDDIHKITIPVESFIQPFVKNAGDDKETVIDFIKNVELQEEGDFNQLLVDYISKHTEDVTTQEDTIEESSMTTDKEIKDFILTNSDLYSETELDDMDFDTLQKAYIDIEANSYFDNETKDRILTGTNTMDEQESKFPSYTNKDGNTIYQLPAKGKTIGEFLLDVIDNEPLWNFISNDLNIYESIETEDGYILTFNDLSDFTESLDTKDDTITSEEGMNEEMKHPALVNLDRIHAQTGKDEKEYFNSLNTGVKKGIENPLEGGKMDFDYDKDAIKKDDMNKYKATDGIDKFVELNRGRAAYDLDFDLPPSKVYMDRLKDAIGEDNYKAMLEKAKLRALERKNERDVETQINTFDKKDQISKLIDPKLNEIKMTGKYTNAVTNESKFVNITMKDFTQVDSINENWKQLTFEGLGNKYSSLIKEHKFQSNGVEQFMAENDFYLDVKENKVYSIKKDTTSKINPSVIQQIKESTNFKSKK